MAKTKKAEPVPASEQENRIVPVELVKPTDLMARAQSVADVCREIVNRTVSLIQGKRYVRVEGWEAIAAAHGCFAGADSAERSYDEKGEHIGYHAKGYVRNKDGVIIATGEGYVGFDEKDRKGNQLWKNRAEYAGRAMAQTRAISRVCRSVFAHVVVLIDEDLSTTPAEEMVTYDEPPEPKHDRTGRTTELKSDTATTPTRKANLDVIRAFIKQKGVPEGFVIELCRTGEMASDSDESLDDLKDGVLFRLTAEKMLNTIVERWKSKQGKKETPTEKPAKAAEVKEPESKPEAVKVRQPIICGLINKTPAGVMEMAGLEKWQDVIVQRGPHKDVALADLTEKQLNAMIKSWKPDKGESGGYDQMEYIMDAALTLASIDRQ